jgi:transposase, IS30 family
MARMAELPAMLLRSITWDQGTEMARHRTITRSLTLRLSFALAARLEREHERAPARLLPQGHRPERPLTHHLLAVENELNNRPRRVLGDRTPAELFAALLASENPSVL